MTLLEPEAASVPDQAPLAVQEVAFPVVQVTVALCPGMTEVGARLSVTIAGGAGGVSVTGVVTPEVQPERTKAERKNKTETKERAFPVPVGTCIKPPFACTLCGRMLD